MDFSDSTITHTVSRNAHEKGNGKISGSPSCVTPPEVEAPKQQINTDRSRSGLDVLREQVGPELSMLPHRLLSAWELERNNASKMNIQGRAAAKRKQW